MNGKSFKKCKYFAFGQISKDLEQLWTDNLIIVKPETVIDWQRRRFKRYWTKISSKNKKYGRKITKKEIRDLIYQMAKVQVLEGFNHQQYVLAN